MESYNSQSGKNLPCVCSREALRTLSFDHLMQWMNVMEESKQKMVHQTGKKQLAYQLVGEFQTLPVMHN